MCSFFFHFLFFSFLRFFFLFFDVFARAWSHGNNLHGIFAIQFFLFCSSFFFISSFFLFYDVSLRAQMLWYPLKYFLRSLSFSFWDINVIFPPPLSFFLTPLHATSLLVVVCFLFSFFLSFFFFFFCLLHC
uniref:Uncharacterized protein n=1 Tax=Trypanosoma vivax (strain Y486) TaxID=1055687 RepID=G0UD22_TRYVY|nr:hypothetical protein TVY486_1112160 [Trypanosoma vivax Y486]